MCSLKQALTRTYSWLRSHGSVVFLALFLLVSADIIIRFVPRPLLADWIFWTVVAGWMIFLLLTIYVSHHYTRIRYSIRIAVYLGSLALAGVFASVGFIAKLSEVYWSPIIGLLAVFNLTQLHEVLQNRRRSRVLPPITPDPEDQFILQRAQELCHSLQLSQRFNPLYTTWTNQIFSDEIGFEDGFQKRNLLLPLRLKGKLNSEEFRALIAAYLLEQKTGLGKFAISFAKIFLPLIVYAIVFTYEVHTIVSIPYADLAWGIGYVVIAAFSMKLLLAQGKKQSLEIDLMTAQLVGREFLLGVFKKIDDLKLHDLERLSAKRDLRAKCLSLFKVSLQERIDNLTKQ